MIDFYRFCCVCLVKEQQLQGVLCEENNISYCDKLSILIPEINIDGMKEIGFMCNGCKKYIDDMYRFRIICLSNNGTLQKLISQLRLEKNVTENTPSVVMIKQQIPDVTEDDLPITCNKENGIEKQLKIEKSCDNDRDTYENESVYISEDDLCENDDINRISKINVRNSVHFLAEPITDEPLECNTSKRFGIEMQQNKKVRNSEDSSLQIDVDSCIKTKTGQDLNDNKSDTRFKQILIRNSNQKTNIEYNIDFVSSTCEKNRRESLGNDSNSKMENDSSDIQPNAKKIRSSSIDDESTGDTPIRLQAKCWRHFPRYIPPTKSKQRPQRRCKVCVKRGLRSETTWECKRCLVALHIPECFEIYHSVNDY